MLKNSLILSALTMVALQHAARADVDWPVNGGPYNIRYSSLTQVDRANVGQLQVAWSYDSHDSFKDSEMQSNPIVVDGTLYATTPTMHVIALDAATGRPASCRRALDSERCASSGF
jgi:quinoprotein glucose dehydrogenase